MPIMQLTSFFQMHWNMDLMIFLYWLLYKNILHLLLLFEVCIFISKFVFGEVGRFRLGKFCMQKPGIQNIFYLFLHIYNIFTI